MRRHRNYEGLPNLADPEPDETPHRSSSKIRYDDPSGQVLRSRKMFLTLVCAAKVAGEEPRRGAHAL